MGVLRAASSDRDTLGKRLWNARRAYKSTEGHDATGRRDALSVLLGEARVGMGVLCAASSDRVSLDNRSND